jgi:hypothetical protein
MRAFAIVAFLVAPFLAVATPVEASTLDPVDDCRREAAPHYRREGRDCERLREDWIADVSLSSLLS